MDYDHSALTSCATELRAWDEDRWLITTLVPAKARGAIISLFALNLELARIREQVSEPTLGEMRLQFWRDAVQSASVGEPAANPVARMVSTMFKENDLSVETLIALVDARELDMRLDYPADIKELEIYATKTGGALWRAAGQLLSGVISKEWQLELEQIGVAHTLVGLLRAAPYHMAQGRVYFPRDLLQQHGISFQGLVTERGIHVHCIPIVGQVVDLIGMHLAAARSRRAAVPRALRPLYALATLTGAYVYCIRKAGNNPFIARRDPGPLARRLILGFASFTGRF